MKELIGLHEKLDRIHGHEIADNQKATMSQKIEHLSHQKIQSAVISAAENCDRRRNIIMFRLPGKKS